MGKTNRICKTCGKAYYYCPSCTKSLISPQWMLMWDTENCKNIFEIVSNYAQGIISKDVARKQLEKCDLKNRYSFKENIRKLLDEILAKNSVQEKEVEKPIEEKEVKNVKETKEVSEKSEETKEVEPTKKGRLFESEKITEEKK